MNNFTKDELQKLAHVLSETRYSLNLLEKVEDMIENYCEHEWFAKTDKSGMSYVKCSKCGGTYE